jgi:hypothetical protein
MRMANCTISKPGIRVLLRLKLSFVGTRTISPAKHGYQFRVVQYRFKNKRVLTVFLAKKANS